MRRLSRGLALILALAMLVLAGCGTKQAEAPKNAEPKAEAPAKTVELNFYFPVAVGGAVAKTIEGYVSDFNAANPNIKVTPVFAGNYAETMTKVQTAIQGGKPPEVAVLLSTDVFTLLDLKAIVPFDDFAATDKEYQAYISDFLPAFMKNSVVGGKTYGIPFQRSTPVLYYNKEAFKEVGLDPEKPPKNWDELVAFGKQLTKPDGSRWGVELPSDGYPYWIFGSFFIQAGRNIVNEDGTEVYFNTPEVIEGLEFIKSLSATHKIMPPGVLKWGDVPNDFITGKAAMIYHTTGSIGNIKSKMDPAKIGMAFMPAGKKGYGAPTGGGNLFIFKTTPEKQAAAYKFVKFMTETERMANWGITSGYVAARKSSWETEAMKKAVAEFPGYKVALDQLQYADRELATHQNQQVLKAFGDQLQAVVNGTKTPKEAMEQAQKDAEAILKPFKK
ncbi:MAG: ABC transporter substrate-binding protein [Bacillota bacterium]